MGGYGLIRVNLLILPDATKYLGMFLAVIGVISIIYGALCAMAQTDLKRLIAYSSIGHMGFVLLGLASLQEAGINGAIFQMVSHGLLSAMLFLLVGVIYDRVHHRFIVFPKNKELLQEWHLDPSLAGKKGFGGLGLKMPVYTGIVSLAFFASLGLPGLSGFVGEVLSLLGAFATYKVLTMISVLGIVIGAAYFLWAMQRIFLGGLNPRYDQDSEEYDEEYDRRLSKINLGVYPSMALDMIKMSVTLLLAPYLGF